MNRVPASTRGQPSHHLPNVLLEQDYSKEVIETIILDPFEYNSIPKYEKAAVPKDDSRLERPGCVRLISFENQRDLSKKLHRFMLARMRSKEKDLHGSLSLSSTCSSEEDCILTVSEPTTNGCAAVDRKHCIVDLDEAHDRWPAYLGPSKYALSSSSSSNNSSSRTSFGSKTEFDASCFVGHGQGRPISVIPVPADSREPPPSDGGAPAIKYNNYTLDPKQQRHPQSQAHPQQQLQPKQQQPQQPQRRINLKDVLRTRQWGRRVHIPTYLLRPPLIQRLPSSQ